MFFRSTSRSRVRRVRTAADTAEKLAADGKQVFVVTESRKFAAWMKPCHKDVMLKRFAGGNGEGLDNLDRLASKLGTRKRATGAIVSACLLRRI